jgi:hypothetical protein
MQHLAFAAVTSRMFQGYASGVKPTPGIPVTNDFGHINNDTRPVRAA